MLDEKSRVFTNTTANTSGQKRMESNMLYYTED